MEEDLVDYMDDPYVSVPIWKNTPSPLHDVSLSAHPVTHVGYPRVCSLFYPSFTSSLQLNFSSPMESTP